MTVIISEMERMVEELKCRVAPETVSTPNYNDQDFHDFSHKCIEKDFRRVFECLEKLETHYESERADREVVKRNHDDRLEALENIQSLRSDAQNEACKSNAIDRSGGQVLIAPPQEKTSPMEWLDEDGRVMWSDIPEGTKLVICKVKGRWVYERLCQ